MFGAFRLDGIERLALHRVDIRQVPRLESFTPLRQLPLRHLHLECSSRVADAEVIGELTQLESLHLEQAGTPRSFAFMSSLAALECLEIEKMRTSNAPSIAALIPLRRLRTLTLGAERGELRELHDLTLLGEIPSLQAFRMYGGPKLIESIHWINQLRELESFDMFGTEIGDGDLTPILESASLRKIRLNPFRQRYSHSEAQIYAILRAKAVTTERRAGETT